MSYKPGEGWNQPGKGPVSDRERQERETRATEAVRREGRIMLSPGGNNFLLRMYNLNRSMGRVRG